MCVSDNERNWKIPHKPLIPPISPIPTAGNPEGVKCIGGLAYGGAAEMRDIKIRVEPHLLVISMIDGWSQTCVLQHDFPRPAER